MKELVTVVIPVITLPLTPLEEMVLDHSVQVLKDYTVIFISADGADLSVVLEYRPDADVITFPGKYFGNRKNFGQLLLLYDFYERFNWAEFMLIHELNSWIVKNELVYWCHQGYDFLKAKPIFDSKTSKTNIQSPWNKIKGFSADQKTRLDAAYEHNGFQLVNIERMMRVLKTNKKSAHEYRQSVLTQADSVFWDVVPNKLLPQLRKPTEVVQNYFAQHVLELSELDKSTQNQLPFCITGIAALEGATSEIVKTLPYFP